MNKTVKDIVLDYLKSNGFDGLYLDDGCEGCGCGVDDLCACGEIGARCKPAYRFDCVSCRKRGDCDRRDDFDVIYSTDKDFCQPEYVMEEQI